MHGSDCEPKLEEAHLKKDAGKLRLDLIPVDAMEELSKVYAFGAQKYAEHSWEGGMKLSRVYAALLRHLFAWWRGEDRDPESGLSHLAHVTWNAVALLTYTLRGTRNVDDRVYLVKTASEEDIWNPK